MRRGLVEDALYWASELDQSGQGKSAIDRLTVVASEDASLSVPHMPIYVNQLHKYVTPKYPQLKNLLFYDFYVFYYLYFYLYLFIYFLISIFFLFFIFISIE